MNKSQDIVDRILKKVWSDIGLKLNEGIYTEEFLKSFYYHLIDEVGEKNADILIQEFQRETENEEEDSENEKEIDKFGMLTQIEKEELKKKKEESISKLGELLSEASIYDSKYAEGDKFLPLTKTAELFSKGLPKGEKVPKGPFTKMGQSDDFVEVNISAGKTVFVKGDDTNKVYKITASDNTFKSLFGKMRKGKSVNDINWDTETLETAACMGLYVNGFSILKDLNSAKTQDELPSIINSVKQRFIKALGMSGEYAKPNNILSKIDTMPLGDYFLTAQLMAGMTKFTEDLKFKGAHLIHKNIKGYYNATERSDLVDGVKDNTADCIVSSVPGNELISKLGEGLPVEFDSKGVCKITGTNIKFLQVSLKKGKEEAQLGKIYGFLKDKYGLLSTEDVYNLSITEGLSDFFKRGIDFIKNVGTKFMEKLSQVGALLSGFGKKISSALQKSPTKEVSSLEKQLQRAGMKGNLKEGLLGEAKVSMWDSLGEIANNQKLLDIVTKNTNDKLLELKKAAAKNPAFYYDGYKKLKIKAPIQQDDVAKLLTNFQSAIVLKNMLGDLESDSKTLYSKMIELEKEMIYGKSTLPLYKVYGVKKDGSGTAYEQYPGAQKYVEEKLTKDLSDVVVFYLYTGQLKNYFSMRGYGLSGISEKTGDLKYSQFRMGTNSSGRYSYNFEGVSEIPLGKVKKSLKIK
tara:strand:- start:3366 stop:5432 length:2067 start_codon:yes stop_codon:yes gene_type:complete